MSDEDRAQDVELATREMEIQVQLTKNPPKPIKINCRECEPDESLAGPNCEHYKSCVDDVARVREANKRNGLIPRW